MNAVQARVFPPAFAVRNTRQILHGYKTEPFLLLLVSILNSLFSFLSIFQSARKFLFKLFLSKMNSGFNSR